MNLHGVGCSYAFFEVTSRSFVMLIIPINIGLLFDIKLDCIVASSDSSHVPLQLGDLSTLVESSDLNKENERDKSCDHSNQRKLVDFKCQGSFILDACELHKEAGFCLNVIHSTSILIQLR